MDNPIPIPAFRDNYIWIIPSAEQVVIVDPGDAAPVIDYLERQGAEPSAYLITHHHYDHIDGLHDLLARYPRPVYGPAIDRIPEVNQPVKEGDVISLSANFPMTVLEVPGHTKNHIAYFGGHMLFCGDTLFAAGCGRVFDGTVKDLYRSLQRLATLPDETLVYCTHEYTLANLEFARLVEPSNPEIEARIVQCLERRTQGDPTLPSTIGLERRTNPFLRCHIGAVAASAERYCDRPLTTPEAVFSTIRFWKDTQ